MQQGLDSVEQRRNFERLLVRNRVGEYSIKQQATVHEPKKGMIFEVGNSGVAIDDGGANAEKLPSKYNVPVHYV